MSKISKATKAIADRHLQAVLSGSFDDPIVTTKEQVISALNEGKTFSEVINVIETKYISITAIVGARRFGHLSSSYKAGVYAGFKELLDRK